MRSNLPNGHRTGVRSLVSPKERLLSLQKGFVWQDLHGSVR